MAEAESPDDTNNHEETENLDVSLNQLRISGEPRSKLRSWLGKILKVIITDERVIVGGFVCTDREGNTILENSWEYTQSINGNNEPRILGLALIPGKHIVSISLMTH